MAENKGGGLGGAAVRGVAKSGISQIVRTVTQMASLVVLSRLLSPVDFGLVAMVVSVVGVADLVRDLGLSSAAIRAPELSRAEQTNLFWVNSAVGLALSLLVVACAPLIAMGFRDERLTVIAFVLAPSFFLSGLSTQHRADLTRQLRFGVLAMIDTMNALGTVALSITAAALGWGYWSLVVPALVVGPLTTIAIIKAAGWLPGRYDRSVSIRSFLTLGSAYLSGSILAYISRTADQVIVGRLSGAAVLGLYSRGAQLVRTPLAQLQTPFGSVLFPVLAKRADNDESLLMATRKAQLGYAYPVAAIAAVVVAVPYDLVRVALGPQWDGAAFVASCAAVSALIGAAVYPAMWIFNAKGLGKTIVRVNIAGTSATILSIAIGAQFGVQGVALSLIGSAAAGAVLNLIALTLSTDIPVRPLAIQGGRIVLIGLSTGLLVQWGVNATGLDNAWLRLLLGILGSVVIGACWLVVPRVRQDFKEVLGMVKLLRKGR